MSINRKDFLKVSFLGGLGTVFGGMVPASLRDKGATHVMVQRQSLVMGSVASFQVVADSEEAGYEAIRKAVEIFRSLDQKLSMYRSNSETASIARQAGKVPVEISDEAFMVLKKAKEMYKKSGGYFDATIEPVMRLWGFREDAEEEIRRPTDARLRKLESIIGSDKLLLEDNKAMLLEEGMSIDVGGIAGGYALDKAMGVMKKCDVRAAFINFSGDIASFGKPLSDEKWKVHILDPRSRKPLDPPLYLYNEALSTSGAYQNRRRGSEEKTWGHLMLPDKFSPVEPVGSVTVIDSSAMSADAWSTAGYVGAETPDYIRTVII